MIQLSISRTSIAGSKKIVIPINAKPSQDHLFSFKRSPQLDRLRHADRLACGAAALCARWSRRPHVRAVGHGLHHFLARLSRCFLSL